MAIGATLQVASTAIVDLDSLTLVAASVQPVMGGTTETQLALVHWQ